MFTSVRKRLVAVLCIIFFVMSAIVPSASFAGEKWNKIKKHFKNCEIKIQGATPEQWSAIVNPKTHALNSNSKGKPAKLTTGKKVLIGIGAVVVAGGIIYVITQDDKDNVVCRPT